MPEDHETLLTILDDAVKHQREQTRLTLNSLGSPCAKGFDMDRHNVSNFVYDIT